MALYTVIVNLRDKIMCGDVIYFGSDFEIFTFPGGGNRLITLQIRV